MNRNQMEPLIGPEWVDFMAPFIESPEFDAILAELKKRKSEGEDIYPEQKKIFRAFLETPLSQVRVIILGMDPYPGEGLANGLAFAHLNNMKKPASMEQLIIGLEKDAYSGLNFSYKNFDTELTQWTKQGVMLMNSSLTVKAEVPGSHSAIWKPFMDYFVKTMDVVKKDVIWLMWGKQAQSFSPLVNVFLNYVHFEEHPSNAPREQRMWAPTSFSKTNAIITANRLGDKIIW